MVKRYKLGGKKYKIVGKLKRTKRTARPVRCGKRTIMKDEIGNLWVSCFGKYWKFPQEIEY